MSAITFVNNIPANITQAAEFRLYQGNKLLARIGVHAGGRATVPTTISYSVQATTSMGEFTLTSNVVNFTSPSENVLAQMLTEAGYFDFQLTASTGTQAQSIVLENTWRNPVTFTVTQPNSPVQIVTVVDEHNNDILSTAQQWTCYVIANGITTQTVRITDPSATITVSPDNDDDAFNIVVT